MIKHKLFTHRNGYLWLCLSLLLLGACKPEEEELGPVRLFRPTLKEPLMSQGNWVQATWQQVKEASSYTAEISKDTFQTVAATVEIDTNLVTFEGLEWETLYQVRVRANSSNPEFNSKMAELGEIKTPRFPTIWIPPTKFDVTDRAIIVRWKTEGAPVTAIRVLLGADSSLVKQVEVTDDDRAAAMKLIDGLQPSTNYLVYLMSGEAERGWGNYVTKESLGAADMIIDLTDIDDPNALEDTLDAVPDGSVIVLKKGVPYTLSSYRFGKSLTIASEIDFSPELATIEVGSLAFEEGTEIESLTLRGIRFTGEFSSHYVFNIDKATTVGTIKIESCEIHSLRGVARIKTSAVQIDSFLINNCVIDSISGYGLVNMDNDDAHVENIKISNSTISQAEQFIRSKTSTNSIVIENCTLFEVTKTGSTMFDYRGSDGANNVNQVKIYNTIIGPGWDSGGAESVAIKGRNGNLNGIDVSNSFITSDFELSDPATEIPGLSAHGRPADELWADPLNGDFTIVDNSFNSVAGDPRWNP
ncbi:DUF5123 domain-containing protein [Catalinimonas alkaloidigena]|nr:DUF5123 domain-containing protein [Catalinimonas alkaloidigena]